ncbi:MAG: VOC family protein [Bryobacteraceae bacterium]
MAKVTGIGGIFFKSQDPKRLYDWYDKRQGVKEGEVGTTVWSLFPSDTKYFEPSRAPFMVNYRVDDLDGMLDALREQGVEIERREDSEYGRFAWIADPEGNRIELWEPPKTSA